MKILGYTLLGFVGLIFLAGIGSFLNLITIPWLTFDSKVQMNRDIVTKTYNADNALYNYHWFQETSADLTATQQKIVNAQASVDSFKTSAGPRSGWSFQEETEFDRLNAVLVGLNSYYDDEANQYNAHASEVDRSIFQNGLPLFFNLK